MFCLRTRDERGGRDSDEVVVVVVPETWELKHDVVGCKCTCKGNGLTHELKDMIVCSVSEFNSNRNSLSKCYYLFYVR